VPGATLPALSQLAGAPSDEASLDGLRVRNAWEEVHLPLDGALLERLVAVSPLARTHVPLVRWRLNLLEVDEDGELLTREELPVHLRTSTWVGPCDRSARPVVFSFGREQGTHHRTQRPAILATNGEVLAGRAEIGTKEVAEWFGLHFDL
jgi:hypothetical protein